MINSLTIELFVAFLINLYVTDALYKQGNLKYLTLSSISLGIGMTLLVISLFI